jgi:primary-amine oxidase
MQNRHPLDPLTLAEIQLACDLLKTTQSLQHYHRFIYVMNEEPSQAELLHLKPDVTLDRIAFVCVLDAKHNATFEARVNLSTRTLLKWEKLPFDQAPYGQAPILPEDAVKCENIVKADPTWRAAMKKRGLTEKQIDLIQVDSFSTGYFGREEEKGKRLVRASGYYRDTLIDNGYARPIEGVIAVVDLTQAEIIRLEDDGKNTPIPKAIHNYDRHSIQAKRPAPKPLDIIQPEGPGFTVNGWQVEWENWKFRIGFTQREGLVLNTVSYHDQDRDRSILHRASITDMFVPYADPNMSHYFKSALDAGENGLGRFANQLELGCDCLGQIHYFDIPIASADGQATLMKHVICMHEEDAGILWKHYEHRTGVIETRRARELVVSFATTIDNYDYLFYWRFSQVGGLKLEVKLTGIVQTAAIYPGSDYAWGAKLTPELGAPMHQHLFNARIHMSVDGPNNAVSEIEFNRLPISAVNLDGNAFGTKQIVLQTEAQGARDANAATQRTWNVFNPSFTNAVGQPTAYKIDIPQTPLLLADKSSSFFQRGGFCTHAFWVTQYDPAQKYASGDYPNQHAGGDGLPAYLNKNRPIFDKPIVLWAVFGATHLPRLEDFPVMPAATTMFEMKPFGFFNQNPALGLPPERNKKSVKQVEEACCCEPDAKPFKPSH